MMWEQTVQDLGNYSTAVVTGIDAAGYPYSVRCRPQPDSEQQVLRVDIPESAGIVPGPASLLAHDYNDQLWQQTSFMVRGTLERTSDGWILRPMTFIPGFSKNPIAMLRMLIVARRQTNAYLAKRGLPRPKVAWDEVKQLWAEVEATGDKT